MSEYLAKALLETGMLETGVFRDNGSIVPFRLRLDMLPSCPDVLMRVADEALTKLNPVSIDRLLCAPEALAFGTAVSLRNGIPLVYSRGRGESPIFDLVGAYDVGHPAGLLINVLKDAVAVEDLARKAKSVGLNVVLVLSIVDTEIAPLTDIPHQALLTLSGIARTLQQVKLLTEYQALAIHEWQSQVSSEVATKKPD